MRIAIDAVAANSEIRTGVGEYSFRLLSEMMKQTSSSEEVVLYTNSSMREHWPALPPNWKNKVLRWRLPFWSCVRLNFELLKEKPDIVFFPSSAPTFFSPSRRNKARATVATVHDVGFARLPQMYELSDLLRQKIGIKKVIKKCVHILAVSNFTKNELINLCKVEPKMITVTKLGSTHGADSGADTTAIENLRAKYRLGSKYFVFVSRIDRKKNVLNLVRGFSEFKQDRGFGDPYKLVIAGPNGFGSEDVREFVKNSQARNSILILGAISGEEKWPLYAGAVALSNVSLYEGFGMTPLEAAACGTPSILSDIQAHREVMGDSALFVPYQDTHAVASAFKKIADDRYFRDGLAKKALERAGNFSWNETARITLEVLRGAQAPNNLFKMSYE